MDDPKLAHELETIELLVARARETVGKHDRRSFVSHAYDEIDIGIVWSAATARLDEIGRMCREEKRRLDAEDAREGSA